MQKGQNQKHVGINGKCHCSKCGHNWTSIKYLNTGIPPNECPICKNPKWNELPKRKRER